MKTFLESKVGESKDTIVLPIAEDISPLLSLITDTSLKEQISENWKADNKMPLVPYYSGGQWIIPVNCTSAKNYQALRKNLQILSHNWNAIWGTKVTLDLRQFDLVQSDALLNGFLIGTYQIGKFKSADIPEEKIKSIGVLSEQFSEADVSGITNMAITQMQIMDLMNGPANKTNIPAVIAWAQASGKKHNYKVTVLDTPELEKLGLEALLTVGRASPTTSQLLLLEYQHPNAKGKKTALVGKGITFDTGGVSIKGSANMHYMKSDMGGAAAVLGAVESISQAQLETHVIGVVPLAENVVAGNAVLPGDIINSYSGKTIEVIDTDAEGRLILADGLFYAQQHYNPDTIIDLATLTGSAVRTFGYHCGAMFSNDDALAQSVQAIGTEYGERLWPLPLWDDYKEDMYSDVADVRNLGTLPLAGCIQAAIFLQHFINDHPSWMHLDIAGVAFGNMVTSKQKAGTGFGIKLLFEYVRSQR